MMRFDTADDIVAAAAELGVADDLPTADPAVLTRPWRVGTRTAPNRLGVHPMEGCDATADGRPDALLVRRWERFAAGGSGVVWGEATAVVADARANRRQLLLTEHSADDFARLVDTTRAAGDDGMLLGLQLTHSGRWSVPEPLPGRRSGRLDAIRGGDAPLRSADELEALAEAYVHAAGLAARAGFDFVDIKHCHGYLLSELLGVTGSVTDRLTIGVGAVREIRRLHPDLGLAVRMNAADFWADDDGLTPDDGVAAAALLVDAGVSLVSVSLGSPYVNPHVGRPYAKAPVDAGPSPEPPLVGVARHARLTRRVADAVGDRAAVVGAGWSWLRHLAPPFAAAVADGALFLGRGALAYPDFARSFLDTGSLEPAKTCLATSQCTALMRAKHNDAGQFPVGCVPRDGEVYRAIYREMMDTRQS